jgi:hypothetical protein
MVYNMLYTIFLYLQFYAYNIGQHVKAYPVGALMVFLGLVAAYYLLGAYQQINNK